MKRILIFSVAYFPLVGGAEIAVKEITDRCSDIEFDMITLNLGNSQPVEKIGNVMVYRILGRSKISKLFFPFAAWRKAKKLHWANNYDATWSIMASYSGFAALFFKFSYPNVPFILTLQEGDPISYIKRQVWFVYPLFKKIFKKADFIQTISNYLAAFAKDMGATCPITVIPNGVDLKLFDQKPQQKNSDNIMLITTSRLVKKNGVADVISALAILPARVKFVILGVGPLELELKEQTKKLKLEARVTFVGQVDYKKIPAYLATADIFVRPSLSEGMGNSFIEAMAAGLPVIGTAVGGLPDFLIDGETGLVCQPRNPKSIAEKVKFIMDNKEFSDRLTAEAKTMVIKNYDWDLVAERLKTEIFAKVLV